jgi:hypothetical protein
MGPIIDRVTVGQVELTFDGRVVTYTQHFKNRIYTETYDAGRAKWKLWESKTLFGRQPQLFLSLDTPGTRGGGQTVCAKGDEIGALRSFVGRAFR